jgi:hypothetical protein
MHTERLRGLFAQYLKEQGIQNMLAWDSGLTIGQDGLLKYERVDKYRVMFLDFKEMKSLMRFCETHGMGLWFGADKLCIGFNYRGCQRLSSYDSVQLRELGPDVLEDRNISVAPEISAAAPLGDRIEPDHYLDVHGGVD